ncbi:hypothetical protein ACIGXG_10015 [Streptomyces goshikiensis]|uniref:hypothetical protein n=1 Tax=Streptomyces goshikiensis TaxID=1942 RepID=UPI0037D899DD
MLGPAAQDRVGQQCVQGLVGYGRRVESGEQRSPPGGLVLGAGGGDRREQRGPSVGALRGQPVADGRAGGPLRPPLGCRDEPFRVPGEHLLPCGEDIGGFASEAQEEGVAEQGEAEWGEAECVSGPFGDTQSGQAVHQAHQAGSGRDQIRTVGRGEGRESQDRGQGLGVGQLVLSGGRDGRVGVALMARRHEPHVVQGGHAGHGLRHPRLLAQEVEGEQVLTVVLLGGLLLLGRLRQ